MNYQPPDSADLANVYSLNLAFLDMIRHSESASALLGPLPPDAAGRLEQLDSIAIERLARCPFLVFSLGEHDGPRWRRLFASPRTADLIAALERPDPGAARIAAAALAFLWQLAKRRPYSARVLCGAPLQWCGHLAALTLVELFDLALNEDALLEFRFADNAPFWRKLINAGTSDEASIRVAARVTALQTMLTAVGSEDRFERLPAAACAMRPPAERVADHGHVSQGEARGYNTPPDARALDKKSHQNLRER